MLPGQAFKMCVTKAPVEESTTIVDVGFRLTHAATNWGESIHVVGDCAELGSWAPEKGVQMITDQDDYPKWCSVEVRFRIVADSKLWSRDGNGTAAPLEIRYKYVRDQNTLGKGYVWEESIEDRKALIPVNAGSRSAWIIKDVAFDEPGEMELIEVSTLKVPTPPVMGGPAPECTPEPEGRPTRVFADTYCLVGYGPLAKGGFSSVWQCRPLSGGCGQGSPDCAVKRISKGQIADRGKRFLYGRGAYAGEIKLHTELDHPNVVKLLEVFDDANVVSLVMQLCRGGDLLEITLRHQQRFGRGLAESAAAAAARQLFSAVDFLHLKGIVHRDIKAENVFQLEDADATPTECPTFVLGDFGLAARVQPDEVLLEQVGSPSTAAPEVVHGRPYGKPADIWSAGASVYTALAARRPFEAASFAEMRKTASQGHLILKGSHWDDISGSARDLLGSVLQNSAVQRPSASSVLLHTWLQH
mmetsp:Transcript_70440/g.206057  ORF Transcript_70440/g.206057 Transcript_70440/m.206057 type:complete len:472 (-) Transcript_70440:127-1542(-)